MKNNKERLYIAYGSNLNLEQMSHRCPTAEVVGTSMLRNWRLRFRGGAHNAVATVERSKGFTVPVLIWRLQPRDELALDHYEGFPVLYRKETLRITVNGKRVRAMIYIMNEEGRPYASPSAHYLGIIRDGYTINRTGVVTCPDSASHEEVSQMIASLRELGFTLDNEEDANTFIVSVPKKGFSEEAYDNLQKIIASKASLLRKALETNTLGVEASADKLIFPWFTLHGLDGEADAYIRLVAAICKMAKEQKRVIARERNFTNEKFTMRVFLIRLGFIGPEYKTALRRSGQSSTAIAVILWYRLRGTPEVYLMGSNSQFPSPWVVDIVRKLYPAGCRVELVRLDDSYSKLTPGERGTVVDVDDTGTVFVHWDCGSSLGIVYGVDEIRKL